MNTAIILQTTSEHARRITGSKNHTGLLTILMDFLRTYFYIRTPLIDRFAVCKIIARFTRRFKVTIYYAHTTLCTTVARRVVKTPNGTTVGVFLVGMSRSEMAVELERMNQRLDQLQRQSGAYRDALEKLNSDYQCSKKQLPPLRYYVLKDMVKVATRMEP